MLKWFSIRNTSKIIYLICTCMKKQIEKGAVLCWQESLLALGSLTYAETFPKTRLPSLGLFLENAF